MWFHNTALNIKNTLQNAALYAVHVENWFTSLIQLQSSSLTTMLEEIFLNILQSLI
jgi:hypothetical protein